MLQKTQYRSINLIIYFNGYIVNSAIKHRCIWRQIKSKSLYSENGTKVLSKHVKLNKFVWHDYIILVFSNKKYKMIYKNKIILITGVNYLCRDQEMF